MKKTLLVVSLIISFILASSVLAIGEGDFFDLIKTGTPDEVKKAIDAGADVNARNKYGQTPLMLA
ncbi:MAG: hypothetical protein PHN37_03195, partial [Candidatus Pacebacteria bacterium]|nr:hypothetical protein [Candidatus Paceibacterota bacterium]